MYHTTRRAINQNLVTSLDASLITKTPKGGECRHVRLLRSQTICWLASAPIYLQQHTHTRQRLLGHTPNTSSPGLNWVMFLPTLQLDRRISAGSRVLWFAQPPDHQAEKQRLTPHEAPVKCIDGCRANFLSRLHCPQRSAFQFLHTGEHRVNRSCSRQLLSYGYHC